MKVLFSARAGADLERLRSFLAEKNPPAAGRAVEALIRAAESLSIFPERGRTSGIPGVRELIVPFGQSAYVVRYVYNAKSEEVVIHRVRHGRET